MLGARPFFFEDNDLSDLIANCGDAPDLGLALATAGIQKTTGLTVFVGPAAHPFSLGQLNVGLHPSTTGFKRFKSTSPKRVRLHPTPLLLHILHHSVPARLL